MMLRLFQDDLTTVYPNMLSGRYVRFQRTAIMNMDRTKDHLLSRGYTVFSNHFLMRLLKTLSPPGYLDESQFRRYYDQVRNNYYQYSSAVGYASPTYTGSVNTSQFYHNDVAEIIIGTAGQYQTIKALPWQELEPVQVHRHPYTTPYYGILDKRQPIPGKGLAVISIDIPTLAYQYLRWSMEQRELEQDALLGTFVVQYPLRNMLKSHNDIAIINRLMARHQGIKQHTPVMKQAYWLNDDALQLDPILDQIIPELKRTPRFFNAMLMQIPTVTRNGYDAVRLPIDISVRQTDWVWYIARMHIIRWLLTASLPFRQQKEGVIYNQIQHNMQKIKGDGILRLRNVPRKVQQTIAEDTQAINDALVQFDRWMR